MRDGRGGATAQECALAAAGCNREDILPVFQILGGRSQSIIALRLNGEPGLR